MKKQIGKGAPANKATTRKAPARKSAPKATKNVLTAGITALGDVHDEALARQSRMFESILGLHPRRDPASAPGEKSAIPLAVALDPFGFRKFEDVFDQRVARALLNLGVPTAEAWAALTAEVEQLRAKLSMLEAQPKKR